MRDLRPTAGLLCAAMLATVALGCAGSSSRGRAPVSKRSAEAFQRQNAEARMLVVRTTYEVAYGSAPRLLAEAKIVRGASAPFLSDSPELAGRAELLDRKGRVFYSIGYRPLAYSEPPGKAMLSTAGPTLRLPWLERATQLRLTEPERDLEVVLPLEGTH